MKTLYSSTFLSVIIAFFTLLGMEGQIVNVAKDVDSISFSNIEKPLPKSESDMLKAKSPIGVEVFYSFKCSGCAIFGLNTVPALQEAYAEKVRAAITRKEPAIRDFFDVFHAVRKRGLNTQDPDFLSLVKAKIDVPGNDLIELSEGRRQELNRQLEGQLRPVLRPSDFDGFNLNQAFELIGKIIEALSI